MAEQDSDLTEQATPYKLDEARKKGSVAKSPDFNAVAVLGALVLIVYSSGWESWRQAAKVQQAIFARLGFSHWDLASTSHWLVQILLAMLNLLAPLFLALLIAAILSNLVQVGPIFTVKPLSPDPERINPVAGLKRLFSLRTLFDAGKSLIKLLILGSVTWFAISAALPGFLSLSGLDPKGYSRAFIDISAGLLGKLVLTLLVIALIDFAYTRWEFAKRMRMSRRDVKDEHKHREGDPRIRSRIRELRKEMLKRSKATRKLPTADVLIVNPTRLAVALSYQQGAKGAPQVVAKGAGDLARKMREVANRHRIPVVQNRMLARTLFREVDYDGFVPEKLYPQVAKIMVWVYTMRNMRSMGNLQSTGSQQNSASATGGRAT
ncbi:MAG: hypothetical protein RL748_1920 [Pseudomonadota bacterium]